VTGLRYGKVSVNHTEGERP
jgi:hypothetical protein